MTPTIERLQRLADLGDNDAQLRLMREQVRLGLLEVPAPPASASRSCMRCRAELIDDRSLARGFGPTCAKHVGAAEARITPADEAEAAACVRAVCESWRLLGVAPHAAYTVHTLGHKMGAQASPWSETARRGWVREVLWILSFQLGEGAENALVKLVEALGFVSLVAVLEGTSVIGKTTVSYDSGALVLKSPRPKRPVVDAIKAIPGRLFVADSKAWTFPAAQHAAVAALVRRYFLHNHGLEEAVASAEAYKPACGSAASPAACSAPRVDDFVFTGLGEVKVNTPYSRDFVEALKAQIPWRQGALRCREWDRVTRCWIVRGAAHIKTVRRLVAEHYGAVGA
jgi:hypothetical protein